MLPISVLALVTPAVGGVSRWIWVKGHKKA